MAGYSGTPLPKKLGIKAGHRVALINTPTDFATSLGDVPDNVTFHDDLTTRTPFDVIFFFTTSKAELTKRFLPVARRLTAAGGLWIAWPKRGSGVKTDLSDNVVRETGLNAGLVDNKVCAIDEMWSGLRFVVRLKDRPSLKR